MLLLAVKTVNSDRCVSIDVFCKSNVCCVQLVKLVSLSNVCPLLISSIIGIAIQPGYHVRILDLYLLRSLKELEIQ